LSWATTKSSVRIGTIHQRRRHGCTVCKLTRTRFRRKFLTELNPFVPCVRSGYSGKNDEGLSCQTRWSAAHRRGPWSGKSLPRERAVARVSHSERASQETTKRKSIAPTYQKDRRGETPES